MADPHRGSSARPGVTRSGRAWLSWGEAARAPRGTGQVVSSAARVWVLLGKGAGGNGQMLRLAEPRRVPCVLLWE